MSREPRRIAVTGGPGGGKTSVLREFVQRASGRIVTLPEVATLMLQHVFPTVQNSDERHALQRAIYAVQHQLESVYAARLRVDQVLLCDRGTPDGGGYWPAGDAAFFAAMGTRCEAELERYDAVVFLETAAAGGLSIAEGNAIRGEDLTAAVEIDRRLYAIWSRHPHFHHVCHEAEFSVKVAHGLQVLSSLLDDPND